MLGRFCRAICPVVQAPAEVVVEVVVVVTLDVVVVVVDFVVVEADELGAKTIAL